jgi:hypothetical protein
MLIVNSSLPIANIAWYETLARTMPCHAVTVAETEPPSTGPSHKTLKASFRDVDFD